MNNRYISIIVKTMLSITLLYIVIIAAASSNVHPDEVDEPYIEDPDMTRMELPFKEPEILFDRELQDEMLERYYEKEPVEPPMFEPDLRSKDSMAKEPEPLIVVPDERNIGKCPKGLRCN